MLRNKLLINNRGDTIVEVLIAIALVSAILIGAYSLSNKATQTNQLAYERSRAADFVKEQSEYLRAARQENRTVWADITNANTHPLIATFYNCKTTPADNNLTNTLDGEFYLSGDASGLTVNDSVKVTNDLYYTWIARKTDGDGYYDFYVYTCWEGMGSIPHQSSGTVVRLESD